MTTARELPCTLTKAQPAAIAAALRAVAPAPVTDELVAVLLAQSALETGHWSMMRCWNFGNAKASESYVASGGTFTYYVETPPHARAPVSETMTDAQVAAAMKLARPRPDSPGELDMVIGGRVKGGVTCWFWARHPETRFRAFETLEEGARDWLRILSTSRFAPALARARAGDVAGYVHALRAGNYFTADEAEYREVVAELYEKYFPVARAKAAPSPPAPPEFGAWVTSPDDAVTPVDGDFVTLPSGVEITRRQIRDRRGGMAYVELGLIEGWLAERGLRLPSPEELEELHAASDCFIAPYTMPTVEMLRAAGVPLTQAAIDAYRNPRMRSERWCRLHDAEVERRIRAAGGDPASSLVSNEGKSWCTGRRILGWWQRAGRGAPKIQDLSTFHVTDRKMTAYGHGFRGVRIRRLQPWLEGLEDPRALILAERCLAWSGYQAGLGVAAIPGPRHEPRIVAYSEHCRRGGQFLGVDAGGLPLWSGGARLQLSSDEEAWCAAGASAALAGGLLPGERPPHGLRVSVRELVEDARATGSLMGLDAEPQPGWLAIEARAGESPLKGGKGHVRRVVAVERERYLGLGANERRTWLTAWWERTAKLRPDGHQLVAWVRV